MTSNHGSHEHQAEHHGSLKAYVIGFIISIVLTIIPLVAVMNKMMTGAALVTLILTMAVLQFVVQLFFFMHVKEGENAKWNISALIFGIVIVAAIVVGSLWIMSFNVVAH